MNVAKTAQMPLQTGRTIVLKCIPGNNGGVVVTGVQKNGSESSTTSMVNKEVNPQCRPAATPFVVVNKSTSVTVTPAVSTFTTKTEYDDTRAKNEEQRKHQTSCKSVPIIVDIYDTQGEIATEEGADVDQPVSHQEECKIDITLRNVVCTFSTRCHLNLREITQTGANVIFKSVQNLVEMKIRQPKCTAFLFSSGKITCTGCTSEDNARLAARKFAYYLKRRGYAVKFCNYKIVNVMATCAMPFTVRLADFACAHPKIASYEPEINPGVTCRFADIKASLKIFTSGKVTVTAPSAAAAERAVQLVYPLVYHHKREDIVPQVYDFEVDADDYEEEYDEEYADSDDDDF